VAHAQATKDKWSFNKATGLTLQANCRHPALDTAMTDQVAVLERLRRHFAARKDWLPEGSRIIALPEYHAMVSAVVETIGGREQPLYEPQHVRFTMDVDQVKELLMGAQLYGNPELAIRELYQNALDACRYRRAREDFLARKHATTATIWQGRIEFVQEIDEQGRAYIECRDNGVGMDENILLACFARAGGRFTDTDEYLEERADWSSPPCGDRIELWPNSRFGIGVFSYFMLADEIRVITCRFGRDGRPGDVLTVGIAGSGSLFRIRRNVEHRAVGTTVRLYLAITTVKKVNQHEDVSITNFLSKNLIASEFSLSAVYNRHIVNWPGNWLPREDYGTGMLIKDKAEPIY
jgi:hypothetical protein